MLTLRMLVLQLPVVQGLLYVILLVMWAEEQVSIYIIYVCFKYAFLITFWKAVVRILRSFDLKFRV